MRADVSSELHSAPPPHEGASDSPLTRRVYDSPKERAIQYALGACALVSVLTTLCIASVLIWESIGFFREVSPLRFLTDTQWTPQFADKSFGIAPLLAGTLLITGIAALVALPLGMGSAIYLARYAPRALRKWLKPSLELLAGVPTVVYGYFALTFVTPLLKTFIPGLGVFNALSAGLVVGIMIIPMVASLSEDAIQAVPAALERAAYALGATRHEVVLRVTVPAAFSGIVGSFLLAISRAIGETMIVTLAAGATPKLTLDPTESIQTMTAFIVQMGKGDVSQFSIEYKSLFAVGFVLFILTLGMNVIASRIVRRYRESY
jgi:phosphate transport system permease protein